MWVFWRAAISVLFPIGLQGHQTWLTVKSNPSFLGCSYLQNLDGIRTRQSFFGPRADCHMSEDPLDLAVGIAHVRLSE
jgi:hypothetical protein